MPVRWLIGKRCERTVPTLANINSFCKLNTPQNCNNYLTVTQSPQLRAFDRVREGDCICIDAHTAEPFIYEAIGDNTRGLIVGARKTGVI